MTILRFTIAKNWYEYSYRITLERGKYYLSCYCTDPNGYYCGHKSYTGNEIDYAEVSRLQNIWL